MIEHPNALIVGDNFQLQSISFRRFRFRIQRMGLICPSPPTGLRTALAHLLSSQVVQSTGNKLSEIPGW